MISGIPLALGLGTTVSDSYVPVAFWAPSYEGLRSAPTAHEAQVNFCCCSLHIELHKGLSLQAA